ncbi:MAG: hypothetical protein HYY17_16200 [Planctomycetes bacterium]|nr:hypothetical protein [Planctomycetota bacterium]
MNLELRCPSCATVIPATDVDLPSGTAKCRECNAVFAFRADGKPKEPPPERNPVPLPAGFRMESDSSRLLISRRWFSPVHVFLVPFTIAWCAFLVFWYSMGIAHGAPWIMFVFPIAHVAVGVGLAYFTAAGLLNRTRLEVSRGLLRIVHEPLPWTGGKVLRAGDLRQFFCREHRHSGKHGPYLRYSVNAVNVTGAVVPILEKLEQAEQALFVEQRIEEHLGIRDRPVPGELPR